MGRRVRVESAGLVLVYLGLGVVSGLLWARLADLPRLPSWHAEMVGGYAAAPNQYRPLTPWVAQLLRWLFPGGSPVAAYLVLRSLVTGITLLSFDRYMRVWFSPPAAAAGAMCLAAIIPFTYFRVVQESDPLNLLVFVLAFWALAVGRDRLLPPLVLVGTLNRETTALLPAVYLLARWREGAAQRVVGMTVVLAGAWALPYAATLVAYGRRAYYCDVVMFWQNVGSWAGTALLLALYGAMWALSLVGARDGPRVLRRALWLLPPYLALHYVIALVWEVRLFLPFAPVIIPLAWWVLFPEERREATRPAARLEH